MPDDLDKLQGTWHVTSLETDGQKLPPVVFNGAKITIKRTKFTSVGMGAKYEGVLELDPSAKPKAFDMTFTAGHAKGHRNLGIYKLDDQRWTFCLATQGNKRPKKFATEPGTGLALETLERQPAPQEKLKQTRDSAKAAKADQKEIDAKGVATELEGEWALVSAVFNGVPMDETMVKWCRRVTRGNITKVIAGPRVLLNASFTLTRSSSPPAIDYLNVDGPSKGKSQAGIFELTGESLKICMSPPGAPRPDDFSSQRGDDRSYTVWRLTQR